MSSSGDGEDAEGVGMVVGERKEWAKSSGKGLKVVRRRTWG